MDNILYVQVLKRKIYIHTKTGLVEGSLVSQLDSLLIRYGHARLNDNTIVNLAQIKSYDPKLGIVYMNEEKTSFVHVSRRNRHKVLQWIKG